MVAIDKLAHVHTYVCKVCAMAAWGPTGPDSRPQALGDAPNAWSVTLGRLG
jgi:hypothetical protein